MCIFKKSDGGSGGGSWEGGLSIPDSKERVNKHRKKLHKCRFKAKEVSFLFCLNFGNNASGFHHIVTVILCNNF